MNNTALRADSFSHKFVLCLKGRMRHHLEIGSDPLGNITRISHTLASMPKKLEEEQTKLANVERQFETENVLMICRKKTFSGLPYG